MASKPSGAAAKTATAAPAAPPAEAPTPPAAVRQQQYDAGTGWELGQSAPEDRYVEVGPDGADVGKPSKEAPAGKYARQVSVKGAPVTADQRAALGLDK
jgi:hypothetical protein